MQEFASARAPAGLLLRQSGSFASHEDLERHLVPKFRGHLPGWVTGHLLDALPNKCEGFGLIVVKIGYGTRADNGLAIQFFCSPQSCFRPLALCDVTANALEPDRFALEVNQLGGYFQRTRLPSCVMISTSKMVASPSASLRLIMARVRSRDSGATSSAMFICKALSRE